MKRLEIIANRSVEADLFDLFAKKGVARHYTRIAEAYGSGNSGPKMGNHVWPEENFVLIVYCEDEEARKICEAIAELKDFFKEEGIKLFEIAC